METVREKVLNFVNFIEQGVAVHIHMEGFGGEGVFDGKWGDMLQEILLKHGSEDAAHKFHDAIVEVAGVVL